MHKVFDTYYKPYKQLNKLMHARKITREKGFTLLEILLVVAIISILAGIVIIAINPAKQLGAARDAERKQMIGEINKALVQFYIDHQLNVASSSITTLDVGSIVLGADHSLNEICNTGSNPWPYNGNCASTVNLSELVPTYLSAIPLDPQGKYISATGNGYAIAVNSTGNFFLYAPNSEGTATGAASTTLGSASGVTAGSIHL